MEKKKPLYSVFQNVGFMLKNVYVWKKSIIFTTLLRVVVIVALPLVVTYLSKSVVQIVSEGDNINSLIFTIVVFSAAIMLLRVVENVLNEQANSEDIVLQIEYNNLIDETTMDMDYEVLASSKGQDKRSKARQVCTNNHAAGVEIFRYIAKFLANVVGLIVYMAIISTLQPLIIVLVLTLTVATYFLNRGQNLYEHNNRDNWTPIDRKIRYVLAKSSDFSHAKDTRLYNMQVWFTDTFSRLLKERGIWLHKVENRSLFVSACSALLSLVRDGLSYGYLIYMIYQKDMSSADFVLYLGVITQFTNWILGIFDEAAKINKASLQINDFRAFLSLKNNSNEHSEILVPSDIPSLKIENVWYRYEGSDDYVIKDFSCTVKRGEKIAIVGLNGAGKTTLIKLLCKLYKPTKGRILVDDQDISEYGRDAYFNLISAVFQDIVLMPTTIAENIAMLPYEDINHTKLDEAVCLSGLESKVESLKMGIDTPLLKSIHSDAVDLSGGEQQKLALARAIYKGGKIIILDEPTAALDPIAENEMYMKYNEIMKGNTSIYISHRLSSTRFCDRILFIENGTLAEQGSHEELMEKAGKYADLFEIQSHYYKEGLPDEQTA